MWGSVLTANGTENCLYGNYGYHTGITYLWEAWTDHYQVSWMSPTIGRINDYHWSGGALGRDLGAYGPYAGPENAMVLHAPSGEGEIDAWQMLSNMRGQSNPSGGELSVTLTSATGGSSSNGMMAGETANGGGQATPTSNGGSKSGEGGTPAGSGPSSSNQPTSPENRRPTGHYVSQKEVDEVNDRHRKLGERMDALTVQINRLTDMGGSGSEIDRLKEKRLVLKDEYLEAVHEMNRSRGKEVVPNPAQSYKELKTERKPAPEYNKNLDIRSGSLSILEKLKLFVMASEALRPQFLKDFDNFLVNGHLINPFAVGEAPDTISPKDLFWMHLPGAQPAPRVFGGGRLIPSLLPSTKPKVNVAKPATTNVPPVTNPEPPASPILKPTAPPVAPASGKPPVPPAGAFNPADVVGHQAVVAPHLPAGTYTALVIDGKVYVARMHISAWELAGKKGVEQFYGSAEIDAAGKVVRLFQ